MIFELVKALGVISAVAVVSLQSVSSFTLDDLKKEWERMRFEQLIEETFIPAHCKFLAFFAPHLLSVNESCEQFFEKKIKIKFIPVLGGAYDFDDNSKK